jgi:hypothetical protein
MTNPTTVEIKTRDGSLIRVVPITADTPHGPLLTISGNGGEASAQIDPTTWATLRGYLSVEV